LVWNIEFLTTAKKQLKKIDRQWQQVILDYLDDIALLDNPRSRGKPLTGDKSGLWRYRVGSYRVICEIVDDELLILVVLVGHRRDVYD